MMMTKMMMMMMIMTSVSKFYTCHTVVLIIKFSVIVSKAHPWPSL